MLDAGQIDVKLTARSHITRLQPGDVVCCSWSGGQLTPDMARDLKDQLSQAFPGHRVIVLNGDALALRVMRAAKSRRTPPVAGRPVLWGARRRDRQVGSDFDRTVTTLARLQLERPGLRVVASRCPCGTTSTWVTSGSGAAVRSAEACDSCGGAAVARLEACGGADGEGGALPSKRASSRLTPVRTVSLPEA